MKFTDRVKRAKQKSKDNGIQQNATNLTSADRKHISTHEDRITERRLRAGQKTVPVALVAARKVRDARIEALEKLGQKRTKKQNKELARISPKSISGGRENK